MAACAELDTGVSAANRIWQAACQALGVSNGSVNAWNSISETSPPDDIWHSLRNCVAYQAEIWQNLLSKGMTDVTYPAAFKMAIVLRHTPSDVTVNVLKELLKGHEQAQQLTSYILALSNDEESSQLEDASEPSAPLRDLQLFGDCELAVLAASREQYDAHAKLVRAEYSKLAYDHYVELRIKVLNQFSQLPKLFNTKEFETLEAAARGNIEREINTLKEQIKK